MNKTKYKKSITRKINDFAVAHYPLIKESNFIDAQYALCNSACHFNSIQAVKSGRADKVFLCWAGGDRGVVHVINGLKGKYFDETWEGASPLTTYRIIREIKEHEFSDIYSILISTKNMYLSMFANSYLEKYYYLNHKNGAI